MQNNEENANLCQFYFTVNRNYDTLLALAINRLTFTLIQLLLLCSQLTTTITIPILIIFSRSFNYNRPEIVHVWKDTYLSGDGPKHSAQMVVDGVNYLTETVYSISAQPSKVLTDWVADKIAPSYWKPNSDIIVSRRQ